MDLETIIIIVGILLISSPFIFLAYKWIRDFGIWDLLRSVFIVVGIVVIVSGGVILISLPEETKHLIENLMR